jgi:nitroreductase
VSADGIESCSALYKLTKRRSLRSFASKKVTDALMYQLLELANRAPSAYNIQPWHFILVRNPELRQLLCHIAMDQEQVLNAPEIVAVAADTECWKKPFEGILAESVRSGLFTEKEASIKRKNVHAIFSTAPFGLFGFVKRLLTPLRRLGKPTPRVITNREEAKAYVENQAMVAASYFMAGAELAGLGTCPIDAFDEERAKALLALPANMSLPLLIAFGYPLETDNRPQSYRIPLLEKLSLDLFTNKLAKAKKLKK